MLRRIIVSVTVFAVLALGSCSSAARVRPPPPAAGPPMDFPLPSALFAAQLVDSTGRPATIGSLRGKVVVISDVLTLCQETCPLDTANVVAAARRVESAGLGDRVEFLSITVDPARDSTARLAAYRGLYQPAPANWRTVTGSPAALDMLWNKLGVFRQKVPEDGPPPRDWLTGRPLTYDVTHSDQVFFLDASGHQRFVLDGAPYVARGAPLPPTIRSFMSGRGRTNLSHPGLGAWTLDEELDVIEWLLDRRV